MEKNLKLALIGQLITNQILKFDIHELYMKIYGHDWDPISKYNHLPQKEIEDFFYLYPVDDTILQDLQELNIEVGNIIYHLIWNQWNGENNYFHITSLDGIEKCKNLKKIYIEYLWNANDLSPLRELDHLESLVIYSWGNNLNSLKPLLEIDSLRQISLEGLVLKNRNEAQQVIDKLKENGVEIDVNCYIELRS